MTAEPPRRPASSVSGWEAGDISVIAVSHLHGDHFGGPPFVLLDGQFRRRTWSLHRAVRYHLHVPDLIAHLDRLRAGRVLLTHPRPQVLERRADLELELAEDGLVVELWPPS